MFDLSKIINDLDKLIKDWDELRPEIFSLGGKRLNAMSQRANTARFMLGVAKHELKILYSSMKEHIDIK